MLSYKDFIAEGGYHVPVVSVSKDKVNLSKDDTRNEINRNLAAVLSCNFINPYGGWTAVGKVLIKYGIALPKIIFHDAEESEEVVALSQFGEKIGASLSGEITTKPEESEFFLYYSYVIGPSGFYETYAIVTDESGIDKLVSEDDDTDYDDEEYSDPRQN
jgi:hypothetical protein